MPPAPRLPQGLEEGCSQRGEASALGPSEIRVRGILEEGECVEDIWVFILPFPLTLTV